MAHPAQPQYGRPGQAPYGYPGPAAPLGYPQGPPQSDPQRYFSPRPQDQTHMYPPTSHSPDPRGRTPPAGPSFPQHQQPPPDSYQPVHHRPESTYDNPQELGTSVYDSPVEHPSSSQRLPYPPSGAQVPPGVHQQFQHQQQEYPPSGYPPRGRLQASCCRLRLTTAATDTTTTSLPYGTGRSSTDSIAPATTSPQYGVEANPLSFIDTWNTQWRGVSGLQSITSWRSQLEP